uniref:FaRP-A n=1 Tax=Ambigolimax valentianus TaxID=1338344 RepID=A0A2Z6C4B2_9EUPU|nr:FaRP-A [Ambigolimax valentianus]
MHPKAVMTLLFLSFLAMCTGAGGRYVSENTGLHVGDELDTTYGPDPQFFRFGTAASSTQGRDGESLPENDLSVPRPDSATQDVNPDAMLLRQSRQFYRFGRNQHPFLFKNYLRLGLFGPVDSGDYVTISRDEPDASLNRNRRFSKIDSQSGGLLHRNEKPDESLHLSKALAEKLANRNTNSQEASATVAMIGQVNRDTDNQSNTGASDRLFNGLGNRFRRFDHEEYETSGQRGEKQLNSQHELDKRFMRFGRRFIRFGRRNEVNENKIKRFMRFGKSSDSQINDEKRFMRFGKRFMRFGKRFLKFGLPDHDNDYSFVTSDRDHGDAEDAQLGSTVR